MTEIKYKKKDIIVFYDWEEVYRNEDKKHEHFFKYWYIEHKYN